jgi:sugar O-acyltransferase (sialic acid O-acetyltransferase NeuD family)
LKNAGIIIVGGFSEVLELAEACGESIVGVIDPDVNADCLGYPILGNDGDAERIHAQHPDAAAFVAVDDPARRAGLVAMYTHAGFGFTNLIHPQARISRTATVGVGVMVQYGAHLSASVRVEDHVRVNVYANLMHGVRVGRCTTVAPNAVVLGRVRIGDGCYIGAHSTILPDVEIGDGSCIGAQATVTKAVAAGSVMVGNPARPHRKSMTPRGTLKKN